MHVTIEGHFRCFDSHPLAGRIPHKQKTPPKPRMSQSLRAIKQFRLRELAVASPKARTPPAATASAPNQPQRPPAAAAATVILNNPFVPHKNPESGRWAPPKYSLRRQADLVKHARESATLHLLPPGPKANEARLQQLQQATAAGVPSATSSLSVGSAAERTEELEKEVVASGLVSVRKGRELERERERGLEDGTQGLARGQDSKAEDVVAGPEDDDAWARSVEWAGTVRERSVAGATVGNRLYAGKKRMFKGHKWERERERRVARTKMLLRDMDKRVQRFKGVRAFTTTGFFFLPPLLFIFHCFLFFFSVSFLC